jgi:glycosyltransferase involved in cell wall biosynthesis
VPPEPTFAGDPSARPLRIALVGPTHPYKGGVAAHTTQTAHRLAAAGHDVVLVSWSRLYPAVLYPGEQAIPDGEPDLPPYPRTVRPLRWDRPGTWWRTGRRLRGFDLIVVVAVIPAQVPALETLIRAARWGSGSGSAGPRVVLLMHNVVPHETHPGAEWLIGRLLPAADTVVVHSAQMARQAHQLGAERVLVVDLPPHLPGGDPDPALLAGRTDRAETDDQAGLGERAGPTRVLALGMVREYKGIDLLLQAAIEVPEVTVTVAGEQWGAAGARVRELAGDPRLAGRVALRPGYVPGVRIPGLLADHDVLALPYRHATASQNVLLARAYRLPVIASTTGTFAEQVRDGVDGLLVPPGDVEALVKVLRVVADPRRLAALRDGVPALELDEPWQRYVETLLHDPAEEVRCPG